MEKIIEYWKNLSRKKKAYISAFATIVGILLWAFISAGVITHNFQRSQVKGEQDRQEAQVTGIILTETKDEHKYWEIYGETGVYDSKTGVAMLDNVIGNFFDENNEVSMSFESSKGTYSGDHSKIILYDNTFIVIKDGTTLNANRLVWSGSENPIVASGNVKITRDKRLVSTADKVTISPDFNDFKIEGHTTSTIYDTKEQE